MKYISKYEIAFKGLKEGKHRYDFTIDDKFFEQFESSEVQKGLVEAEVVLNKQNNLLTLYNAVSGNIEIMCDRCLEMYKQPINNESTLYIKFGQEAEDYDDDIIVIPFDEHQINIAQYLYELIILSLPIQRAHPKDKKGKSTCNPEMEDKLKEYIIDENVPEENNEQVVDERWSELKKLLDNK